ncbi:MAG TPA: ATP-dependent RecD-like DNA helicase [Papillibacter sp.]|nr:ATP-dependent RecD-like DNA helicase [Papillibacter sp.]
MQESDRYIQIAGTVTAIVYQNPDNGYTVLRLDTEDGIKTAVGTLPGVSPGEDLILTGSWTTHPSYGEQFKAEAAERRMPSGADAIYAYLASGVIKNVGPAKARDIVAKFGDKALEIIESEPERLAQVRGFSLRSAMEVGLAFRRQSGLRRLMEFLAPYNVRPVIAVRLFKYYGEEALDALRENPYIMTEELIGADFFEADSIALSLGFDSDCPERVQSAVLFEMEYNLSNGHTFLPYKKLIDATAQLVGVSPESVSEALDALIEEGVVVRDAVAGQDGCYLESLYEAETYVAARLRSMVGSPPPHGEDIAALVGAVEQEQGIVYAEQQKMAVKLAAGSRVMVLTGGPGTGKTTSVRGILALFDRLGLKTALCAPTGRAAKRMSDLTGRDAATIHRMLGAGIGEDDKLVFEYCETNPMRADAVIVDEASMVDIVLMRALLDAIPPGCRLVLVGDVDQLPSVGPGNVFSDIIRSGIVPAVVLTEIFRQAGESAIVRNAHLINSGEMPDLADTSGDFFFMRRPAPESTAETIVSLCAERLPKNMGLDPAQIQVLSPTRKGPAGTKSLNTRLQAALNPPAPEKKEKLYAGTVFREGDKVMQIRNNYDIMWKSVDGLTSGMGVYNGDIGTIKEVDFTKETVTVDFDDRLVTYLFEQLSELEPAWALTVHKAQGSEYKAVVLAASGGARQLLVRSVLYTAITRARELLIIVGDRGVVETMVQTDRRLRRYSGLRARLAE